jgi:hypothetical protein
MKTAYSSYFGGKYEKGAETSGKTRKKGSSIDKGKSSIKIGGNKE